MGNIIGRMGTSGGFVGRIGSSTSKALEGMINDTNARVDTIITTPVEGVSAQEIIDARQGEGSLGANITEVKSQLAEKANQTDLIKVSEDVEGREETYYTYGNQTKSASSTLNKVTKFTIGQKIILDRISVKVDKFTNGARYILSIYDKNCLRISTSGIREIYKTGWNEISMGKVELLADDYYISIVCSDHNTQFAFESSENFGYAASVPFNTSPASTIFNLWEHYETLCFKVHGNTLKQPSNFEFYEDTDIAVFAKHNGTGKIYGWKKSRGRIVESSDSGGTWTELMLIPEAVWGMAIDEVNNRMYYVTFSGKVWASTGLTASASFINITPPKEVNSDRALPYTINIWNGYLWFGEYSGTYDLSGATIFRYDLGQSPSTGTWVESITITNCRHIHAFTPDGDTLYIGVGDANYGNNIGYHKLQASNIQVGGNDTWTKVSGFGTGYTTTYPVDSIVKTIDGIKYLIGAADRPGGHVLFTKVDNIPANGSNINIQITGLIDSPSTETVRNVIFDDRDNLYWVTEETTKHRILVSPPPYTQSYVLYEFNKSIEVLNVVKDGSYFWFGHYKFRSVNFQTQTATISKPLVIYSKGVEGVSLIEESTGTGTGKRVKNTDNLALNAKTTASPNMYYSGYRTSTPVDLTSYATLMVEGEIFNSTGEGFARVSVSTGATPTTNVKESLISIVNNQLTTRKFEIRVDVSALTGVHYLHFQAIGMNIGECNVRVNKVYLHQLGI